MKIRNGFVSNSSSSSFVVVFPKKPKTAEDVFKYMFNGKKGKIYSYGEESLTHEAISEKIFAMLTDKKRAKLSEIQETFHSRYCYYPKGSCVFWGGKKTDELGGSWTDSSDKFWGLDKEALIELRRIIIEDEEYMNSYWPKYHEIVKREPKSVPYAYKGGKDKNGKLYTKEAIAAYEKYNKEVENFRKTDEEYVALEKAHRKALNKSWDEQRNLCNRLAKVDAKAFMEAQRKGFIFTIEIGDDTRDGSIMEHGNIFKNVPHVMVSNH